MGKADRTSEGAVTHRADIAERVREVLARRGDGLVDEAELEAVLEAVLSTTAAGGDPARLDARIVGAEDVRDPLGLAKQILSARRGEQSATS